MKLKQDDIYKGSLILVNASYPVRPEYLPELVQVESNYARIQLEQKTAAVLNGVLQAICANGRILPVSGYRTPLINIILFQFHCVSSFAPFLHRFSE